jgi:uncharacterized damage-inducible protein DinB
VWLKVYSPRKRSPPASSRETKRTINLFVGAAFAKARDSWKMTLPATLPGIKHGLLYNRRSADGQLEFDLTEEKENLMDSKEVKTVANFLIADFENEMQTTLRVFEAVPNSHLDYQPATKSKTGLGLVRHITLEDEWLLNCIANGEFTPPPDDSDACGIMNPADAVARYKEKVPAALNRVRAMSGEKLANVLDLFGMIKAPGVNFLAMALKHSVHHRGQLSTYLRPMGGKVPGIYGPSADTQ